MVYLGITAARASLVRYSAKENRNPKFIQQGRLLPLNGVEAGKFELCDVVTVAFGETHALALDAQGLVWARGESFKRRYK